MLLHIESLSDLAWQSISQDIIMLINKIYSEEDAQLMEFANEIDKD